MNIVEYIESLAERFERAELCFGHGTETALDEAVYLVYSMLGLDFAAPRFQLDRLLTAAEIEALEEKALLRIEKKVPTAYLVGEAWFAGMRFVSDARALVPRSPIAELIENRFEPLLVRPPRQILDLCCGGGCIGLACASRFPQAQVLLADISADCLALAAENIALHAMQERVSLCQSDLFAGIEKTFDLILCNPPYVSDEEYNELPAEFGHEPQSGLVSPGSGLAIPLRILRAAGAHLAPDGVLILELGYSADALLARVPDVPFLWLDFEHGGEGVLALHGEQLRRYSDRFN